MSNTARIDLRINPQSKSIAEKARTLLGYSSLSAYITHVIDEHAREVVAAHEVMDVPGDAFMRFVEACDAVNEPNEKLKDALQFTRDAGFDL